MSASILVVDGNELFLRANAKLLRNQTEYEVIVADCTADALSLTKKVNPDLVLMDIFCRRDEMDGISCVKEMRANGYRGTVCMMTVDLSTKRISDSLVAGADDIMVKASRENLVWEVENFLDRNKVTKTRSSCKFNLLKDGAYLRSRGLGIEQIETLMKFHDCGYPREKELADILGLNTSTMNKRMSRIKRKLQCETISQISQIMTLLSVYAERRDS